MIGVVAGQEVGGVSCVYPLDDDGTLLAKILTDIGVTLTKGPDAIGDGQTLQVLASSGGLNSLTTANGLSSAKIVRGPTPIGFEVGGAFTDALNGVVSASIVLVDVGGTVFNIATKAIQIPATLVQFEMATDGTLTSKVDGAPRVLSWYGTPSPVGPTDSVFIVVSASGGGIGSGTVTAQLRTCATSLTGTYSTGCTDIAGTVI